MIPEIERQRFRQQFDDNEWFLLIANVEFKSAWDSDNFVRAGEIANPIIKGEVDNRRQLRNRLEADRYE